MSAAPTISGAVGRRTVPLWSLAVPLVVVLAAAAVAADLVLSTSSPHTPWVGPGPAQIGQKAPAFKSWDLDGNQVYLSGYEGRPVLLTFWATSCTACQDEFPALERVQAQYRGSGFTILAVDYRETNTAAMKQFLQRLHAGFTPVIDPQGRIASAYGVDIGLPVNVWLDRDQRVEQVMVGEQPEADLAAAAARIAG